MYCCRFQKSGECLSDCGDGFYKYETKQFDQTEVRECLPCHPTCRRCQGKEAEKCTACLRGLILENGKCKSQCSPRFVNIYVNSYNINTK